MATKRVVRACLCGARGEEGEESEVDEWGFEEKVGVGNRDGSCEDAEGGRWGEARAEGEGMAAESWGEVEVWGPGM